jgi:molecular chaperone GrpE (heat shock protein)
MEYNAESGAEIPEFQENTKSGESSGISGEKPDVNVIDRDNSSSDHNDGRGESENNGIVSEKEQQINYETAINELTVEIQSFKCNVLDSLKTLTNSVQDFSHREKINRELHEELQKYKGGLRMEFAMPILRSIVREYDRINQLYGFYREKEQDEPQGELFSKLLKEFSTIADSLLEVLGDYNIEPFEVKEGEDYSTREHKSVKIIITEDPEKDGKVEKYIACGFRDIESGRLFRPAEVNIYKLKK